jgi:hypothetical protein
MRQAWVLGVLAAIWLSMSMPAIAQLYPRSHSRYGGYGGYDDGSAGVWGAYTSAMSNSTTRYIAEQNRSMGQAAAMQQQAMVQSGIRNTLMSQAQTQTQDLLARQQSNRDWWFQVQQQQAAQRRAMSPSGSEQAPPVAGFESAVADAPAPQAATDVIKWLPLLCEPQFAQQRAVIEAPYRRAGKERTNPTAADYRAMINAGEQMKDILKQMTAGISAQAYLNADAFIDQLISEARDRIKDAGSAGQAK